MMHCTHAAYDSLLSACFFLEINRMADLPVIVYAFSTPLLPPTTQSRGEGRFVSARRHQWWPEGAGGRFTRTLPRCELKAQYRS